MSESKQKELAAIAEEYIEQVGAGNTPSIEEFAVRYPEFSEQIYELFPTMELISSILPVDETKPSFPASIDRLAKTSIEDFRLVRELGRGGMGIVYEAEHLSLGRRVALKFLPSTLLVGSERKARFDCEAKAAGRLHHTNIVPVFGIGSSGEDAFLIMQLIPGMSLDKLIVRLRQANKLSSIFIHVDLANTLPETDDGQTNNECNENASDRITISGEYWNNIATLGRDVAEALQYAHEQGILHRDIKPGNLILDVDHRVWVTDFGLAKIVDSDDLTGTGEVLGTIKYMAPERLNRACSAKSDIYSLGITLYELAALRPAAKSSERGALARKLLYQPPPSLQTLRPSMPRDLRVIVEKAMAPEPERRYESARELADDLGRFLNAEPIRARPITYLESTIRWAKRNPLLAGTVTALGACLLIAAIVSSQAAHRFGQLNSELRKTNKELATANLASKTEQVLGQQRETRLLFQRGREFAEQGKIAEGLLLMVSALEQCPTSIPDYKRTIRANISAWSAMVPEILEINEDPFHNFRSIDYCAGGKLGEYFLLANQAIRRIDAETGKQVGEPIELDSYAWACSVNPSGNLVAIVTRERRNELQIFNLEDPGLPPVRLVVHEDETLTWPSWHPSAHSVMVRTENNQRILVWTDIDSPDYASYEITDNMDPAKLGFLAEFMPKNDVAQVQRPTLNRTSQDGRLRFDDQHAFTSIVEVQTGNHLRLSLPHAMEIVPTVDGDQIQCSHFRIRTLRSHSRFPPSSIASIAEIGAHKYWNKVTAAYSSDGEIVVTRDPDILFWGQAKADRKVPRSAAQLWDARTGRPIGRPLQHQFDSVRVVAISTDGSVAATGGYDFGESSGAVYIWDAKTGEKLFGPLVHQDYISALDISPDGKLVAAGDYDGKIRIWDVATGEKVGETIDAGEIVFSVRFDSTGKRLAAGTLGKVLSKQNLSIWDVTDPSSSYPGIRLQHRAAIDEIKWIPDSNRLICYNANSFRLWDVDDPETPIAAMDDIERIDCASVNQKRMLIAIGNSLGSVYLVDAITGEVLPNVLSHNSTVYDVDFSPDGETLAAVCNDGGLRIWDLYSFEQIGPPLMQNEPMYRAKFRPDGKTVLSTGRGGTTRIWNVPQANDIPVDQLKRLVELRTNKRLANEIAWKIPAAKWTSMRAQAIEEKIMLDQAASKSTSEGMPALVQVIQQRDLHDTRARDAEQDKDWFGAHWHLDKMISNDRRDQRQPEWQLFARRARSWSQRSDYKNAEKDYDAAGLLVDSDVELTNWYRHRVVACQRAGEWETAIWYLDRILILDDKDWNSYAARADANLKLGNDNEYALSQKMALEFCDDPIYKMLHAPEHTAKLDDTGTRSQ